MDKFDSLETIRSAWADGGMPLGKKASVISGAFYSAGLDFAATAALIGATPAELDALLAIGGMDDEALDEISRVNPPKTAWTMIANASDEEVALALSAIEKSRSEPPEERGCMTERIYYSMIENADPTAEQRAALISAAALKYAYTKSEQFTNGLNDKEMQYMKSFASQRQRGKSLSEKQGAVIIRICNKLADLGIIRRDCTDGNRALCDEILDALGR